MRSIAISRPLIALGRTSEAWKALTESLEQARTGEESQYADRLGEISVRGDWVNLLLAEGKRDEARQALLDLIRDTEALQKGHPEGLTPVFFVSASYRMLASITSGSERRDALVRSARAWHSWPATTFTMREEERDRNAAIR